MLCFIMFLISIVNSWFTDSISVITFAIAVDWFSNWSLKVMNAKSAVTTKIISTSTTSRVGTSPFLFDVKVIWTSPEVVSDFFFC